jgi:hypothetical protein
MHTLHTLQRRRWRCCGRCRRCMACGTGCCLCRDSVGTRWKLDGDLVGSVGAQHQREQRRRERTPRTYVPVWALPWARMCVLPCVVSGCWRGRWLGDSLRLRCGCRGTGEGTAERKARRDRAQLTYLLAVMGALGGASESPSRASEPGPLFSRSSRTSIDIVL